MAQIFIRLWFSPKGGHSELPVGTGGQNLPKGDCPPQRGTVDTYAVNIVSQLNIGLATAGSAGPVLLPLIMLLLSRLVV